MFTKLLLLAGLVAAQAPADPNQPPAPPAQATPAGPTAAPKAGLGIDPAAVPDLLRAHLPTLLGPDNGVLVAKVHPNTPAAAMALVPGDILLLINGWPIGPATNLADVLGPEGLTGARLGLIRAGKLVTVRVPAPAPAVAQPALAVPLTNLAITAVGVNGQYTVSVAGLDAAGRRADWKFQGTRPELDAKLRDLPKELADAIRAQVEGRVPVLPFHVGDR